ncbi:Mg-chelatase subunit ChlD [Actinokineospora alba]|uniref:Mg-chelatase subunit ChlD n=1 Tax=Actinokineospora alba TaxID=504798 RepID=A0A1H0HKT6_9PSEU|nr:VWA domain-containing protein [Actinokineospora alba]TDP64849.1 Mg-chelatase subunit ChlD [Actinokineospora alba]SDH47436.1 Mg-chelatase subunit ChlD [Actinokineospora alba]SDO19720.1 Mg-chelatase subunit ChlD [Actinokineospora alba]
MTDPSPQRWRLILGEPAEPACPLGGVDARRDTALRWLYGREEDLESRGVRRGGSGESELTTVDWLDEVHRLFPKETIERLERDAVERYQIHEIVTDPDVLGRVEPNPALLRAVLRTKHLMNPDVLAMARKIIASVVRELVDRLALEVRRSFSGTRQRRRSNFRQARNFDFRATIKANLAHYQPEQRRVRITEPRFVSRTRRQVDQWQLMLLVDQSGSMVDSVIHSAVTASCLWSVPGLRTHLVAFDTAVVDLTSDVTDPVELLMKVQLGGGTDIAKAVRYGAGLIDNPRRSIVAVISDFYEGGDEHQLVRTVRELVEQGTQVLCLAALDGEANPNYDRDLGQRLADTGASVGAMTPGELAQFVAERLGR